ncbi:MULTISPECIES: hypothetical protein [Sphingomonas]|jgi:hypothetical protein|uniref:hypothetical protein n=1 Tax=Sphingomonas TaxID=13687 RepID=UPI00254CC247|nr:MULTISPECIES: hypothetical protein [Sphingomonas]MDK8184273.1 hypothetical protein [Sphingomonas zeae]MDK8214638.1 hypothetical protein [Sphingomonas sp. UMB7805-LC452B]
MPQPYPAHLFPEITVDTAAALEQRTECVARGMAAIAQHSMAESMVSNVLTAMLHADPGPAAAIYGTIRNGKLQRDALMAVADELLPEDDRKLFDKVLGLLQSSARGRDQLAHSLWAVDPKFAEAVILVRPDQMWRFSAEEQRLNGKGGPTLEEAEKMQQDMRAACTVWNVQDMLDVRTRGVRAFAGLIAFGQLLKSKSEVEAAESRQTLDNLFVQASART